MGHCRLYFTIKIITISNLVIANIHFESWVLVSLEFSSRFSSETFPMPDPYQPDLTNLCFSGVLT